MRTSGNGYDRLPNHQHAFNERKDKENLTLMS